MQAALFPFLVINLLLFLRRVLQRALERDAADDAVAGFLAGLAAQLRIIVFPGFLVLRRQVVVARRDRVVRRALEHGQVLCLLRDHRDRLDRGRAGADDADAQAGEVHAFMRPMAGVVGLALEACEPLEVRRACVRQRAGRHDHVLRRVACAVVGGHRPAIGVLVEHGRGDARVELDVGTQVEAVGDVVGVFQDFRLRGKALGPLPLLLQLVRERVRILHALDVAACAGIAVPVPGAADARTLLEGAGREAEAAQAMQQVHAGETCADDDHVEAFRRGRRVALGLAHRGISAFPFKSPPRAYRSAKLVDQLVVCDKFSIRVRKAQGQSAQGHPPSDAGPRPGRSIRRACEPPEPI